MTPLPVTCTQSLPRVGLRCVRAMANAVQVENGFCPCGNKVRPWYQFFSFHAAGFLLHGYPGADEAQAKACSPNPYSEP